ncbi:MAG TPA: ATP-binding protein, partial [Isosphaeraceae bacterium]|nr:ATP-binding protein [Isosphaeraceae bacterium]
FFYNDAYARMTLGPKHPWALGRSAREVWSEIWEDIGPRAESVIRDGQATWDERLLLFLERQGFPEETYHTFSYSPVPDDQGAVGGLLCVVTEDTEPIISERRLRTLRELAARTTDRTHSAEDACKTAVEILAGNPRDVPFALLYLLDDKGRNLTLAGWTGVEPGTPISPLTVELPQADRPWPFRLVAETREGLEVDSLPTQFGRLPGGAWPEPAQRVIVNPMAKPGQSRLAGFVVAGVSPRCPYDDAYRGFFDLLSGQIATAVANARAHEEERHRVQELAELDRAKTVFFSNVSHEFRTPLSLLLSPVEDLLAKEDRVYPENRELLWLVHRNALRLQKLVNTLLDFSRIEAGRARASYEPTDLAALTADLASNFRSACQKAGLELRVDCPPLPEPVYVDTDMWEKVVLNLLSNAFKFTLEGRIEVRLSAHDDRVELEVRDTGTGIPPEAVSRLFERFHRIEGSKGRTQEGSGIGLALVRELVRLHGGDTRVESTLGEGSAFSVSIPCGTAHLPAERV